MTFPERPLTPPEPPPHGRRCDCDDCERARWDEADAHNDSRRNGDFDDDRDEGDDR